MNRVHPILLYSAFGMGKTALTEQIARKVCKAGQKARLITSEHYNTVQDAVDEGFIEVWKVNTRNHPFETMRFAVEGYFPVDPLDPTSKLIAPTPDTWEKYPVRIFEGIATIAAYLAGNYAEGGLTQRAESERIGFEKEYIAFTDGETSVAGMTWTYFNIAQAEMVSLIQRSQKFPGYVLWTSHEDMTKDKRKMAPEVIGTAQNSSIGKEFADVLHITGVPVDFTDPTTGEMRRIMERRLYLKEHYAPNGPLPYAAKNSVGLRFQDKVPDYLRMSDAGRPLMDVADRLFKLWNREFAQ